jgi:hypothetical protein
LALLVDDLLSLPIQLFEVIFNTVVQTAAKGAWVDYRRRLNIALISLHRDYEEGKITKNKMRALESNIFKELRLANTMIGSSLDL